MNLRAGKFFQAKCKMKRRFQQRKFVKMPIFGKLVKKRHKPLVFVEPCGTGCDIITIKGYDYVYIVNSRRSRYCGCNFWGETAKIEYRSAGCSVSFSTKKRNKRKIIQYNIMSHTTHFHCTTSPHSSRKAAFFLQSGYIKSCSVILYSHYIR